MNSTPVTDTPATGKGNRARFVRLMHDQILKLNQAELDFGIYRILNRRRHDIRRYLETDLPQILAGAVQHTAEEETAALRQDIEELRAQLNQGAKAVGYGAGAFDENGELFPLLETSPHALKYREKTEQLAHLEASAEIDGTELDQLYFHLLTFFGRYYQGGDFLTVPRRGRTRYLAPYGGEDTLFHWRSKGSHYVKTATELTSYSYRPTLIGADLPQQPAEDADLPTPTLVRFELLEADTEQNNVKGTRRYFVPLPEGISTSLFTPPSGEEGGEVVTLNVPFAFRPLTEAEAEQYDPKAAAKAAKKRGKKAGETELPELPPELDDLTGNEVQKRILAALLPPDSLPSGLDHAELLRQSLRYARKNTSDYFVHPHLGPFLHAELDHYLLTEYLTPQSLSTAADVPARFARYQALREAAGGLIDFLHQLEDFQAQLFEKRKFVLSADYLVPLRLVPRTLWPTLLHSEAQLDAWQTLFGVELHDLPEAQALAELATLPTLVVDTRWHASATKYAMLANFDDLEANLDGVLVHSENYAALRTLAPTYAGRVRLTYIDPPYNTGGDGFLYKDEYSKHSTWLSMMQERLLAGRELMSEDGALFASIDDDEQARMTEALRDIFNPDNFVANIIWQKKYSPANDARYFSDDHDFILVFAKNKEVWRPEKLPRTEKQNKAYQNPDDDPKGPWKAGDYTSNKSKDERPTLWYAITNPNTGEEIWPAEHAVWRYTKKQHLQNEEEGRVWWGVKGTNSVPAYKRYLSEMGGLVPRTIWPHTEAGHNQDGVRELAALFGASPFASPKPTRLLERVMHVAGSRLHLDFFAGSGTTGHAAVNLARNTGERHRFVLVEMGEYFEPVTFARIAKVMFAPDWKAGVPEPMPRFGGLGMAAAERSSAAAEWPEWVERSPRLVQVLRLESFEDSLEALELPEERTAREQMLGGLWGNDYLLRYMLGDLTSDHAVNVAVQQFQNPWVYELRGAGAVDLPETFNLLLGLKVQAVRELWHGGADNAEEGRRYLLVRGVQHGTEEAMLVVWRDLTGDFDAGAEREWLGGELARLGWAWEDFTRVWVNGDSVLPRAQSLDAEFRRRMLVRDSALLAQSGLPVQSVAAQGELR